MTIKQMLEFLGEDYDVMTLDPNKLKSDKRLKAELIALQREIKIDRLIKNPDVSKKHL